jgi:hypothetical protein
LVGVWRGTAGLIGRTTALVGLRGSFPKTWAALDGIAGAGVGVELLPNVGRCIPKIFFFGLFTGS